MKTIKYKDTDNVVSCNDEAANKLVRTGKALFVEDIKSGLEIGKVIAGKVDLEAGKEKKSRKTRKKS